jgi:DNA integrity scanning protein DisA with diadenylate cyclase activity
MSSPQSLPDVLARIAPGTTIRNALERIVQHGNGALVVMGTGPEVEGITTGGFELADAAFTSAKLAELAKMDGPTPISCPTQLSQPRRLVRVFGRLNGLPKRPASLSSP